LRRRGRIEVPAEVLAPDHAEDLDVDDVGSSLVGVGRQSPADRLSPG
jgi:hypothetical protein